MNGCHYCRVAAPVSISDLRESGDPCNDPERCWFSPGYGGHDDYLESQAPGCYYCRTVLDAHDEGLITTGFKGEGGMCNTSGNVTRAECAYAPGHFAHEDYWLAQAFLDSTPTMKGERKMTFAMLDVLRTLLAANIPVKLESLPGAGKTSYMNALWRASNGYLHTMVAVNHDPTDFGGIPAPDLVAGKYKLLPGEWATDVGDHAVAGELTGIFLDEVNTAGRAVLSACLKLVDERRVGNYQLPASVRMVLAMNPAEANGGVDLTPAMANRVAHLKFSIPATDWAEGVTTGFPDPEPLVIPDEASIEAALGKWVAAVAGFTRRNEALLERYPAEASQRTQAWPSRRTWTLSARALATAEALGLDPVIGFACVASLVGQQPSDAFADWYESQSAIDITEALVNPDGFVFPTRDDELFITLDRILDVALDDTIPNHQENINAAGALLVRVAGEQGRPGVAMANIKRLAKYVNDNRQFLSGEMRANMRVFQPIITGGTEGSDQW